MERRPRMNGGAMNAMCVILKEKTPSALSDRHRGLSIKITPKHYSLKISPTHRHSVR